jgi:hypothetical protein
LPDVRGILAATLPEVFCGSNKNTGSSASAITPANCEEKDRSYQALNVACAPHLAIRHWAAHRLTYLYF